MLRKLPTSSGKRDSTVGFQGCRSHPVRSTSFHLKGIYHLFRKLWEPQAELTGDSNQKSDSQVVHFGSSQDQKPLKSSPWKVHYVVAKFLGLKQTAWFVGYWTKLSGWGRALLPFQNCFSKPASLTSCLAVSEPVTSGLVCLLNW